MRIVFDTTALCGRCRVRRVLAIDNKKCSGFDRGWNEKRILVADQKHLMECVMSQTLEMHARNWNNFR